MTKTKRKLFECLGALREATQANVMLTRLCERLCAEIENDRICGTWWNEDGRQVSIHKAPGEGYKVAMFQGTVCIADMLIRSENGRLNLYELLLPYPTPVVHFRSSDLLMLGPHGIFRRKQ